MDKSEPEMVEQQISVSENGPYLVTGGPPVRRRAPIVSEQGEPLTWKSGEQIETKDRFALCRCGGSGNKPFCDGTHARAGFDGTETAPTDTYDERRKQFPGTGIDVYDDRSICEHAGFCANHASNVWKMADKTDDTIVRAQVMAMIERCPSGALTFEVDGDVIEPELPSEIGVITDGPLWVTGGIPVARSDGEPLETRNRVTLCRCGGSNNKPLCDGTHKEIGFSG